MNERSVLGKRVAITTGSGCTQVDPRKLLEQPEIRELLESMDKKREPIRLAIDPGVRKGHGVAVFRGSTLCMARMVKDMESFLSELSQECTVTDLTIEIPVVRQTGRQKGRQSDIIDLALAAGKAAGQVLTYYPSCSVVQIKPEEWKGQLTKRIGVNRVKLRLTEEEKNTLLDKAPVDVYDAIGIGFHVFDRTRALR